MNISVLSKASKKHIVLEPYPHIVIENALDEELYKILSEEYPSTDEILAKDVGPNDTLLNNTRYQVGSNTPLMSSWWNQFVDYHVSRGFYNEVSDLLGTHIDNMHQIKDKYGFYNNFKNLSSSKRGKAGMFVETSNKKNFDVGMDCQVGINSPATEMSRVIGMHVDQPNKLYVGMLYMREEEDDSVGGHLQIYKHKDGCEKNMDIENMEIHSTIEYARNTAVFFVNSPVSIHSVTLRHPTPHRRRLINFIGEI